MVVGRIVSRLHSIKNVALLTDENFSELGASLLALIGEKIAAEQTVAVYPVQ